MEEENQKYLWKYLSLDKFNSLLNNKSLYLPSLKRLQLSMDPIEGATSKCLLNSAIKQMEKSSNGILSIKNWDNLDRTFKKLYKESLNSYKKFVDAPIIYSFIYSMTYSERENYSLWHIYPTDLRGRVQINQGLSLKMDEEHFKTLFVNKNISIQNNNLNLDIAMPSLENVIYKTKQEINELINSDKIPNQNEFHEFLHNISLIKNDFYDFAKEKRYIVELEYDIDAIIHSDYKSDTSFIKVSFDIKKFFNPDFCKIIISPFATETLKDYVKFLLEKQNIKYTDDIVCDSEIAIPN